MNELRLVFAVVASVLSGFAFYFYAKQVKLGQSKPNIATWSISVFLMLLNTLTFQDMSKDKVATLQLVVGFAGAVIVFFYALVKGKFSRPKPTELLSLLFGVCAGVVWYVFRQAASANMIILLALLVALYPTWKAVYQNPFSDTPRSWVMWSTAYSITTVNILLGMSNPDWHAVSLINPVVGVVAHGLVAFLSRENRKLQFQ
ncbi:MAG: hypothetical protein AAB638_01080 [Patescibacteria group bacterium]